MMLLKTLPDDSKERKDIPLFSGLIRYAPAALAGVAKISKKGNDKHNPGQQMHHARGKSKDHKDCLMRHLMDSEDILASMERFGPTPAEVAAYLEELDSVAWRALMHSQEQHERFTTAPLAPGAKVELPEVTVTLVTLPEEKPAKRKRQKSKRRS